ncbi:MAG: DUF2029 domain-containing protein [Lewinellaceae bacterium]|nr:DUF2029 domain-containing protein [Lewinellaceae bacterium]
MKPNRQNWLCSYSLLSTGIFLGMGLLLLWQSHRAPFGDYANYYYASRMLLDGQFSNEVYDPYSFNTMANRLSPYPVFVNYTPVPPASVPAYLPFASIRPVELSKVLFGLLGLLLFCRSYFRLAHRLKLDEQRRLLLVPFILSAPLLNNFQQGQSYLWLVAFLTEGFLAWQKGRTAPAAMFWAVPITLKLFPAILLLFLLLEKDFRCFFLTLAFTAILSLLPMLFFSPLITENYFLEIVPRLFRGEINDPFSILYQSGRALLFNAFIPDAHLNPQPWADLPGLALAGNLLLQVIVLASAVFLMQEKKVDAFSRFAVAFLAGLLLTGYGSSYSLVLLLLPLLALPVLMKGRPLWQAAGWLLIALAANVPVYQLHGQPLGFQFPRLYALLTLLALLLLAVRPAMRQAPIGVIAFLFTLKGLFSSPAFPTEGAYYLPDGRYGIIHDYETGSEGLRLQHFNELGAQQTVFATQDKIQFSPDLKIKAGQVFWKGSQLTCSRSQKRRPALLGEHYVLYLSDEGRGVGFFTLRKIRLP